MASPTPVEIGSLLVARPGYRDGRPCLRGTGITVHAVAAAYEHGMTAEKLCEENPDLDPSLIHAALAYYFANREQVNADLDQDEQEDKILAARYPNGITVETLQADP